MLGIKTARMTVVVQLSATCVAIVVMESSIKTLERPVILDSKLTSCRSTPPSSLSSRHPILCSGGGQRCHMTG